MTRLYELARRHLPWLGRVAALVCGAGLGLLTSQAHAGQGFTLTGWTPVVENTSGGGWRVVPNQFVRTDALKAAERILESIPGGVSGTDPVKIAGRAGELPVRVRQAATIADAGAAIGKCIRNPVCAAAAVAAGVYIYTKYRTKRAENGDLQEDAGQSSVQTAGWSCRFSQDTAKVFYGGSPEAACNQAVDAYYESYLDKDGNGTLYTSTLAGCEGVTGYQCTYSVTWYIYEGHVKTQTLGPALRGATYGPQTVSACPPVVDFSDPAYSVPGGPVGRDGKCPTGRYDRPLTPEDLGQKIANYPPPVSDTGWLDAIKDVLAGGQDIPASVSTSGPASQVGTPASTTTTTSSGTTTTTSTPTYNYTYNGDTISYSTSNETKTCAGESACSTTTTTTTGPKEDAKDPCESNPNRVGCLELGTAPDDKVQKVSKDLSFAEEGVSLPAACPADVTVRTSHGDLTMSYSQACDMAQRIAPLVKALGALGALLMVAAAVRSA